MRLPILLLSLSSVAAFAQSSALVFAEPGRAVALPPTSVSLVEDVTALDLNPAGLSRLGGMELAALMDLAPGAGTRSGVFFGSQLGPLAYGASYEWLGDLDANRKLTLGLSLGSPQLSFGFNWNRWSSEGFSRLDRMSSWDLGLSSRPADWLTVGAALRNVDAPSRSGLLLPRTLIVGAGVRPFGERLTLAADYTARFGAFDEGTLSYTLWAQVLRGLNVLAGVGHPVNDFGALAFQVGISAELEHASLALSGGAGGARPGSYTVLAKASSQKHRGLTLPGGKVGLVDLADQLRSGGSPLGTLVGGLDDDPYLETMAYLDAAVRDPELRGVLLKIDSLPDTGMGKVMELRSAMLRLRAAGKRVVAVLMNAGDVEYLLATGADRVYAMPESMLMVNGLGARPMFLGGTMEKLGVRWDVARVGAFKNAPDQLTRTAMSPEQREAITAYLGAQVRQYEKEVLAARQLSPQALAEALAMGILPPKEAKRLGLLDEVITPKELEDLVDRDFKGASFDARYEPRGFRRGAWGARRRIAIVPVLGSIDTGKSRRAPLGGELIAGSETIVRALERAKDDPRIAAIVLRVDSPGGGVLASDLIYRAVISAREKKPVIASMGDVAASGGYYVSAGADEIFATPGTITGSIGVFSLKPALEGLFTKLGVSSGEAIVGNGRPEIMGTWRPWTEEERQLMQRWVDGVYEDFIGIVGNHRKLSRDQVDAIARGRVWSGEDAKSRGLVDTFGGLEEAIASAKKRVNIPEREEVDLVVLGEPSGFLAGVGGEEGVLAGWKAAPALPPLVRQVASELAGWETVVTTPGVQARMEYSIRVE